MHMATPFKAIARVQTVFYIIQGYQIQSFYWLQNLDGDSNFSKIKLSDIRAEVSGVRLWPTLALSSFWWPGTHKLVNLDFVISNLIS